MLLPPRKQVVLERLYARYGRRLLRRSFASVNVGGAQWPAAARPSIALLNHSAWWDPILALHLSHDLFRRDGYGIMQGAQLERYPFFRRVGCFGMSGSSISDTRALAELACELLRSAPRRTLWLFPQGELLPARMPLHFRSGTARIALHVPHALIVPVAIRYEMRRDERPECYVRIGPATEADSDTSTVLTRRLERALASELAALDDDLRTETLGGYRPTISGRRSMSALYDRTFGAHRARHKAI